MPDGVSAYELADYLRTADPDTVYAADARDTAGGRVWYVVAFVEIPRQTSDAELWYVVVDIFIASPFAVRAPVYRQYFYGPSRAYLERAVTEMKRLHRGIAVRASEVTMIDTADDPRVVWNGADDEVMNLIETVRLLIPHLRRHRIPYQSDDLARGIARVFPSEGS